jgi:hypothetical protein
MKSALVAFSSSLGKSAKLPRLRDGRLRAPFAIVVSSAIMVFYLSFTGAGRAADVIPAGATFANNTDDHIRSDAGGAYLDGVDGVRCIIDLLDDFILQLHYNGKKNAPRRELFFDFNDPVPGSINRGTFFEDAFLNVDSIGTLAVGESRSAHAQFNTQIGLLRFNPSSYPGTSYVLVTRTSATTWEIVASAATGGDVAALVQQSKGNSFRLLGNYHMPFKITVQLQ